MIARFEYISILVIRACVFNRFWMRYASTTIAYPIRLYSNPRKNNVYNGIGEDLTKRFEK
jgi:hypothetical protein